MRQADVAALRAADEDPLFLGEQGGDGELPGRVLDVAEGAAGPADGGVGAGVFEGAAAEVRLSSFDARTTPRLPGTVVLVSADRVASPDGAASWYVASVEIDGSALSKHPELRLRPGMPAELFVATPERTLFQYLARPLTAFAGRAMREP